MTPAASSPWFSIDSTLAASLATQVAADRVRVDGRELALDGRPLCTNGAVKSVALERGQLIVETTLEALIAANARDAIFAIAAASSAASSEGANVLGLVGQGHPALVVLLHRVFGQTPAVATAIAADDSLVARLDAARLWRLLLGNQEEANRLLGLAIDQAKGTTELVACAAAARSIGANEAARRVLDHAKANARSVDDQLAVVLAAVWLFGDRVAATRTFAALLAEHPGAATRCRVAAITRRIGGPDAAAQLLDEAEAAADDAHALALCAEARLQVLGDEAAARKGLDAAQAKLGFGDVARVLARTFHDEAAAKDMLAAAEKSGSSAALTDAAGVWLALWQDVARSKATVKLAEEAAKTSGDWAACAAAWNTLFADTAEVKRCLAELEKGATTTADWNAAAGYWIDVLKDNQEAARCVGRAEEVAASSRDFLACARNRHAIGGSIEDIARSLTQSEERSKEIGDLSRIASAWHTLARDDQKARATLARAEAQAWAIPQFVQIAQTYRETLGDPDAARKTLVVAAHKAQESAHFGALARAYKEILQDDAETTRWQLAEMEADAGPDLVECARGWRRILGDGEAARQRLREREATAEGEETWRRIALAWSDGFEDAAEADRAVVWAERWKTVDKAMEAKDWVAFGQSWKEILNDTEQAKARLRAAEERANTLAEWAAFGVAWHRVFEDLVEAKRCIKQAEAKTRFKSDWKSVAEAWRQIGDYGEAQRCLDHRA